MTSNKYVITQLQLDCKGEIPISREEYEIIYNAKQNLVTALGIEERFDILMENYFEFEMELLSITSRSIIFDDVSWNSFANIRSLVNRRLMNLFSSAKAYIDQTSADFSDLFGKGSIEYVSFKESLANEYDQNIEYRTIEALRNFTQHQGLPVHWFGYHGSRNEKSGLILNSIEFAMDLTRFERSKKTKKKLVKELRNQFGDQVKLKQVIRKYMEALVRIHIEARKQVAPAIREWDEIESKAIERFEKKFGQSSPGLALAVINLRNGKDDGVSKSSDIFADLSKRRRNLEHKNGVNAQLSKQQVSSHDTENT